MGESHHLAEIVRDTRALLKRYAGNKRTIALSPETAAMFNTSDRLPKPTRAPDPERLAVLDATEKEVSVCTLCALHESRTQTVFGDGNPCADLVFVGEGPGAEEDRQGKPFVGRAGKLLTDIIEKGMKLERSDVYICNVVKCRPPGNREPLPEEAEACNPYLVRQLESIRPRVICALGACAAKTLLDTKQSLGRLRGEWHFYRGIPLRVTYHPAYLLRNPPDKRKTWDDIKHIMRLLSGDETPEPPSEASKEGALFSEA